MDKTSNILKTDKPTELSFRSQFMEAWNSLPQLIKYWTPTLFSYSVPFVILYCTNVKFDQYDQWLGIGGGAMLQSTIIALLRKWDDQYQIEKYAKLKAEALENKE